MTPPAATGGPRGSDGSVRHADDVDEGAAPARPFLDEEGPAGDGPGALGGPGDEPDGPGGPGGSSGTTSVPASAPRHRRRGRLPLIGAIVVGCVTALLVAVLATSKDASNTAVAPSPLQDKAAPEISGPTLNGGNGSLFALRGKWVLVNFFASWCVPCQQEQNDLVKFQNTHLSGDAVIFAVRFDDPDTGPIEDLMNKSGGKWPVVDDPNAKIDYSVTGPPESFLVSPGGIVLLHITGPITDSRLEQLLDQAKLVVTTPTSVPTLVHPGASTP